MPEIGESSYILLSAPRKSALKRQKTPPKLSLKAGEQAGSIQKQCNTLNSELFRLAFCFELKTASLTMLYAEM